VLIPTALPAPAAARQADAARVCGARAEARRLHHALRVARPRTPTPSAQIAVANAVTAVKPGGVLIVPVARNAMLAPILSLRRAGIRVVRLSPSSDPRTAAAEGAHAVIDVVAAIERHNLRAGITSASSLLAPCASVP
jgi:ABC-type sugar transport system substrate-binding protein